MFQLPANGDLTSNNHNGVATTTTGFQFYSPNEVRHRQTPCILVLLINIFGISLFHLLSQPAGTKAAQPSLRVVSCSGETVAHLSF
jgi:hypothetical protein